MEKVYHIYAKDICLYHSLREEEFHQIWHQLNSMVGIMKTDYNEEDLTYEELSISRDQGPAGGPSY